MYRRKEFEKEDEDQHERWLLSYADLITLLFAFFVVMYATSTINLNKYRDLSKAVVTAFQGESENRTSTPAGVKPTTATTVVRPLPLAHVYAQKKAHDQEKLHALGQSLANALGAYIDQHSVSVYENSHGIHVDIQTTQLLNSTHTNLTPAGIRLLSELVKPLLVQPRSIWIEGHSALGHANAMAWLQTANQAALVVQQLVQLGLPAKQLRAIGLADTQPFASGDTTLARDLNQRISVVIPLQEAIAQTVQDYSQDSALLPMTVERLLEITQTPADAPPSTPSATQEADTPPNNTTSAP